MKLSSFMYLRPFTTKLTLSLFIFGWWFIAFHKPGADEHRFNLVIPKKVLSPSPVIFQASDLIKPTDRGLIKKALSGDVELMVSLIQRWDVDASYLQLHGKKAKRISREKFIQSQMIGRALLEGKKNITLIGHPHLISDGIGTPFDSANQRKNFLPQTYASAGILLALIDSNNIVALPKGMRKQTCIYDPCITSQISADFDKSNLENLSLNKPDLSFASLDYSDPTVIRFLHAIGSDVFLTKPISNFDDIKRCIADIGWLSHTPIKAELLNIFIEASILAINNWRDLAIAKDFDEKVMIATYFTHFSIPGKKSITSSLIKEMGIHQYEQKACSTKNLWLIPITEEEIVSYNPDRLILMTDKENAIADKVCRSNSLRSTSAYQKSQILFVPEDVQMTPSQYLVLAYYDLNAALCFKEQANTP